MKLLSSQKLKNVNVTSVSGKLSCCKDPFTSGKVKCCKDPFSQQKASNNR